MEHEPYESPAVEERAEVGAPLNLVQSTSESSTELSPTWRTRRSEPKA